MGQSPWLPTARHESRPWWPRGELLAVCQPTVTAKLIMVWVEGILNGQVQDFWVFFFRGRICGKCYFVCGCCVFCGGWRGGDSAGLPMDFNCVDQVCWFSLSLLMCGTLEMANDFSSHLRFATWWLSSFKHFLPQIPPKAWLVWLACGICFEKQFFPIPFANLRNISYCEQCWRHGKPWAQSIKELPRNSSIA